MFGIIYRVIRIGTKRLGIVKTKLPKISKHNLTKTEASESISRKTCTQHFAGGLKKITVFICFVIQKQTHQCWVSF